MIGSEQLHARILERMDMTREIEDEELTQLIYHVLKEASEEEYLSLDEKHYGRTPKSNVRPYWAGSCSMHSGSLIFFKNSWRMRRSQRL